MGVAVAGLVPDGPAARAGVREGDVIRAVNFIEVSTREDVYRQLWKHSAEAVVRLGIVRETERLTIEVASADRAEFYR